MTGETIAEACFSLGHKLADVSADVIRPHFRAGIAVDLKSDDSPVTVADKDSEAAMRDVIRKTFPDHGIIGEEHGAENADAEFVWVLDPIDGTRSFIAGVPLFCTLIGLVRNGAPWLGIINQPVIGDRWTGGAGNATKLNGAPASVRSCAAMSKAVTYTTGTSWFSDDDRASWHRLAQASAMAREGGTDAYGYGMVASGWIDVVCEAGLQFYDFAALVPVIENAGGKITDWTGAALTAESSGQVLAAGDAKVHAAAIDILTYS